MEEALIQELLASSSVAALCATRIRPLVRDQRDSLPSLVVTLISHLPEYAHDGPVALALSRVQIDAWGKTYLDAKRLARAAKAALSGRAFLRSGVSFQGVFQEGERDGFEGEEADKLYRTSLDLMVWHTNP